MTRALLDVNVLIALLDRQHTEHRRARSWLEEHIEPGWATCPLTANGFVRTLSQPRYPNPVAPAAAMDLLAGARGTRHHAFWPCDVSLLEAAVIDRSRVHGPGQVTDAYLLALAVHHGGRFATFDRAIALSAVSGSDGSHLAVV